MTRQVISQVANAASAYAVARYYAQSIEPRLLVVSASIKQAESLFEELLYLQKTRFLNYSEKSQQSFNQAAILHFQDREILAYDQLSPPSDLIASRLTTLNRWCNAERAILVVAASTACHKLPDPRYFDARRFDLSAGDKISIDEFTRRLLNAGYDRVQQVEEPGQYAQRGGVVDIFPIIDNQPFRLDLFDDEIESIKHIDIETQRSTHSINQLQLLPANEFVLDRATIDLFLARFEARFKQIAYDPVYQAVGQAQAPAGLEYFLPLLHQHQLVSLADYAHIKTCLFTAGAKKSMRLFLQECERAYRQHSDRKILPVAELFCNDVDFCKPFNRLVQLSSQASYQQGARNLGLLSLPQLKTLEANVSEHQAFYQRFQFLCQQARQKSAQLVIIYQSSRRRQQLLAACEHAKLHCIEIDRLSKAESQVPSGKTKIDESIQVILTQGQYYQGFYDSHNQQLIATEADLFGRRLSSPTTSHSALRKTHQQQLALSLSSLVEGDLVVHLEHGIGIYKGLQTRQVDGYRFEGVSIAYKGGSLLSVPVDKIHFLRPYVGQSEGLELDQLGKSSWNKRKRKAKQKAQDVAAELLKIYAERQGKTQPGFSIGEDYQRFVDSFAYQETPDQQSASAEVVADLSSNTPMDRLICGDVGFGKTEIAMRAAFISVTNAKQVVVLVPTTLLAQQHYQSFLDRFADWPVQIGILSRLASNTHNKQLLKLAEQGEVDILIGTHRLLQKDVTLPRLGLVVIDEEHRFGVKQKEIFKKIRAQVNLLSMTATPIPRSLNLAFAKLRDISIISSPPAGRMAVKTFVSQWQDQTAKEAILREIYRGGQVFFVHNQITTIENRRGQIQDLVPGIGIEIAHGQMPEKQLQQITQSFYNHQFDILLCTTIIESGIDIANANTILIDRADQFGLAQLHQLRGRVGRSHHQAYAYLFTPDPSLLKSDASRRLQAIEQAQGLGSGFKLALEDLEIRGAGEILGDEQKGHIQTIGLDLYLELLQQAMRHLAGGSTSPAIAKNQCQIELGLEALIPSEYVADVSLRLQLYDRLAECNSMQAEEFRYELLDRFGPLPEAASNLIEGQLLKNLCYQMGIQRIIQNRQGLMIELAADNKLNIEKILAQLEHNPTSWMLKDNNTLQLAQQLIENLTEAELMPWLRQTLTDLQTDMLNGVDGFSQGIMKTAHS